MRHPHADRWERELGALAERFQKVAYWHSDSWSVPKLAAFVFGGLLVFYVVAAPVLALCSVLEFGTLFNAELRRAHKRWRY